jgi:hypothetical protein
MIDNYLEFVEEKVFKVLEQRPTRRDGTIQKRKSAFLKETLEHLRELIESKEDQKQPQPVT